MDSALRSRRLIGLSFCSLGIAIAHSSTFTPFAYSQLVPDTSLGSESSTAIPNTEKADVDISIEGGSQRGENLFHSFEEFNIEEGQSVYFSNPAGVFTIFNRITGSNPSKLLGTLGIDGSAELFFLNPNGILFGADARLDIAGSAIFSSAESIEFKEGAFSTTSPEAVPLLNISAPIGLQYGSQTGNIRVEGEGNQLFTERTAGLARIVTTDRPTGIQGGASRTLGLVGGDIELVGGNVGAFFGRVEIGAVGPEERVGIERDRRNGWRLDYSETERFQDIQLTEAASINASETSDLQVVGQQISLLEGSAILTTTVGFEPGGSTDIQASERFEVISSFGAPGFRTGLYAQNEASSFVTAGTVNIDTPQLLVSEGGIISAANFGEGTGREVNVSADSVMLSATGAIETTTAGTGAGGNINIDTRQLEMDLGGLIDARTFGAGAGGSVNIVSETIEADTGFITSDANGSGPGGSLSISANTINLQEFAIISAGASRGSGAGGNISINNRDQLSITGGSVSTTSDLESTGSAGNIAIETGSLFSESANFFSFAEGRSNAGNISVTARDDVVLQSIRLDPEADSDLPILVGPSDIRSSAGRREGAGQGGDIRISARSLLVRDGSVLRTNALGVGDAGDISVETEESVVLEGVFLQSEAGETQRFSSGFQSLVGAGGEGAGGKVSIDTAQLIVREGARVETTVETGQPKLDLGLGDRNLPGGIGRGGLILVEAADVSIAGSSSGLFAGTERGAQGPGGQIIIDAERLTVSNSAQIDSQAKNDSPGGNIAVNVAERLLVEGEGAITVSGDSAGSAGELFLTAPDILLNNGEITAQTASGDGGDITIEADNLLLLRNQSDISATAGSAMAGGDGGNITLNANFIVAPTAEDSDITANAFEGAGGEVNIESQAILGIQARPEKTELSDITASSAFGQQGVVTIDAPETTPGNEEVALPDEVVDPSEQIGQSLCAGEGNSFSASGRGGLPSTPYQTIEGEILWEDWYIAQSSDSSSDRETTGEETGTSSANTDSASAAVIEAQSWTTDDKGNVVLTENAFSTTPEKIVTNHATCQQLGR